MADEEKIKQKYMRFQMIQQHLEQISQHLEMLNQQEAELDISVNAVKELGKIENGNEVLAPLADGILFKAKLEDNTKLIVNVGSNTTVEKTIPQVVKLLEEQQRKISKKIVETEETIQEMSQEAMKLYQEVEEEVE